MDGSILATTIEDEEVLSTQKSIDKLNKMSPEQSQKKMMRDLASFETFNEQHSDELCVSENFRGVSSGITTDRGRNNPIQGRTVLPIEKNNKLGAAVIARNTVKSTCLDRQAVGKRTRSVQPLKFMDKLKQIDNDFLSIQTSKDPKAHDWRMLRRNIKDELFQSQSFCDRMSTSQYGGGVSTTFRRTLPKVGGYFTTTAATNK